MPVIAAALVLFAVLALSILLLPLSLIQRYRVGTRRRPARPWITTLNLAGVSASSLILLFSAALMSPWIPGALTYAAFGLAAGAVLGMIGLVFTRWESTAAGLHFTPPWLLVVGLTLIVTGRLLYGFWRAWHGWGLAPDASAWLQTSGATGSLAAGATVLGYYVLYWWGVRGRIARHPPVRRIPRS
jgi:hypothetical protein